MAPSVLLIGLPWDSPTVPADRRESLHKALDAMEADLLAVPYDFEMFYTNPGDDISLLSKTLQSKRWDVAYIGAGLRTIPAMAPFFQQVINIVHREAPGTVFAFNTALEPVTNARDAIQRALAEADGGH